MLGILDWRFLHIYCVINANAKVAVVTRASRLMLYTVVHVAIRVKNGDKRRSGDTQRAKGCIYTPVADKKAPQLKRCEAISAKPCGRGELSMVL